MNLTIAVSIANMKPNASAIIQKYKFQITPLPIKTNWSHRVMSLLGRSFSPIPIDLRA